MAFTCMGRFWSEGTDGGESIFKSLVGAVKFCYRDSAIEFDLQPMKEDSSLPSLKGQLLIFQGSRGRQ
jgi:hypothetical protein